MKAAVIGLGFGDEGKGMVVNYLCGTSPNTLVIRYSGGHQAGHTVYKGKTRHVFANFGSGTLNGHTTYWSKFCTIEPRGLMCEYQELKKKSDAIRLLIDGKCPVTTPFDIIHGQTVDRFNGTCGVGFGATLAREEAHFSLLAEDLKFPSILKMKIEQIKNFYRFNIGNEMLLRMNFEFEKAVQSLLKTEDILIGSFDKNYLDTLWENHIYEGSQGLLLDQDFGFFPHVTRSSVGTRNIQYIEGWLDDIDLYLVTRAYQTRHGIGPMTNENMVSNSIKIDNRETNVKNEFQGGFRRTILDLDLIKYAIGKDQGIARSGRKNLVITCLDHLKNTYFYTLDGKFHSCQDENQFISSIKDNLPFYFDNIFISHSPYSSKITKWNGRK